MAAAATVARAETPIPDPPAGWVTDRAAFLSKGAADDLDRKLADYARGTSHQVLVYIDHTTGGVPIEDWGVKAFERWRVGRKGIDDGLVLFVFSDDHRVRIEVGYGLEPTMPDARASRIIREVIVPRIQAGDRDGAVRGGVDAILATLGGAGQATGAQPAVDTAEKKVPAGKFALGLLGLVVVGVLLLGFALTHPGLAWLLTTLIGSGRGGGGWGGGGGFGGGGGGGGGFSGGGGSSGGGGASGSW